MGVNNSCKRSQIPHLQVHTNKCFTLFTYIHLIPILLKVQVSPSAGDLLSGIRYTGFESTRAVLGHVKSQVQILSTSPSPSSSSCCSVIGPTFVSTPLTSPMPTTSSSPASLGNWTTPSPSAPENPFLTSDSDPPPPYNNSFNG